MSTSKSNKRYESASAPEHRLLSKEDVAEVLHTTPRHVERLAEQGLLSHYRVGRFYRFQIEEVQDYLDRTHIEAGAGA